MFQQQVTASGDVKMSRNSVLLVTEHEIVGALEMLLGLSFFFFNNQNKIAVESDV